MVIYVDGLLFRLLKDFRLIFSFRVHNYLEELPEFVDHICVLVFTTAYAETFCLSYIVELRGRCQPQNKTF